MSKSMSLRLDDEQAATLELIARAGDTTTTDEIRAAIERHIDARRQDADFQERLSRYLEEEKAVLERLAR